MIGLNYDKLVEGVTQLFTEWRDASKDKVITFGELDKMLDTLKKTAIDVLQIRDKPLIKL